MLSDNNEEKKKLKRMRIIVIDEIDNLIQSGSNSVLPCLFSWTAKNSSLILIGISNAVALSDNFCKHLLSTSTLSPHLSTPINQLVFHPYSMVISCVFFAFILLNMMSVIFCF